MVKGLNCNCINLRREGVGKVEGWKPSEGSIDLGSHVNKFAKNTITDQNIDDK